MFFISQSYILLCHASKKHFCDITQTWIEALCNLKQLLQKYFIKFSAASGSKPSNSFIYYLHGSLEWIQNKNLRNLTILEIKKKKIRLIRSSCLTTVVLLSACFLILLLFVLLHTTPCYGTSLIAGLFSVLQIWFLSFQGQNVLSEAAAALELFLLLFKYNNFPFLLNSQAYLKF